MQKNFLLRTLLDPDNFFKRMEIVRTFLHAFCFTGEKAEGFKHYFVYVALPRVNPRH